MWKWLQMGAFLLVAVAGRAGENTVLRLEANRERLYLGESFILRVTISGPEHRLEPDVSGISNSKVELLGSRDLSRHSLTVINGRMTKESTVSRVISYAITPLSAGEMRAGPVRVAVNGKTLTEPGPLIHVRGMEQQDLVKVTISSSHETALIHEPFEITLTILIRCPDGERSAIQPLFPDSPPNVDLDYLSGRPIPGLSGPDVNRILKDHLVSRRDQAGMGINDVRHRTDPFSSGRLFDPGGFFSEPRRARFALNPRIVEKNGVNFFEYSLTLAFTPHKEGDYIFGPAVFKGPVLTEIDEHGTLGGTDVFAVGRACTVRVTPPPEEGRPPSFTGAVGSNLAARASLDAGSCKAGDPLKLSLTLSGDIRFDDMLPPRLGLQTNLLERFRVYDGLVETVATDDHSRRYIYTLRPIEPGTYDLPPVEISYYDTLDRRYKKIFTDPIALEVGESKSITPSKIIAGAEPGEAQHEDLVPAPIRTGADGAEPVSFIGNPYLVGGGAAAGPLLYLAAVIGQFINSRKDVWRQASQRRRAAPRALARLASAQESDRSNASRARAELYAAVRQYLADRFPRRAASLTPAEARRALLDSGAGSQSADKFCAIFENIFNAGYSNSGQLDGTGDICEALGELIPQMEREMLRGRKRKVEPREGSEP